MATAIKTSAVLRRGALLAKLCAGTILVSAAGAAHGESSCATRSAHPVAQISAYRR